MADLETAIPLFRESVLAVLRIDVQTPERVKKGKVKPAKVGAAMVGSAFCVVRGRFLVTAHHVFNNGQTPDPNDRFYAFAVPQNGDPAFHFPIVAFTHLKQQVDLAIIELGAGSAGAPTVPALPVTFRQPPDGSRVLTLGFPSPEIVGINLDPQLNYRGGQFFLKSHGNEGIVSAQYSAGGVHAYELNVGWHHGESGGPIVTLSDPPAAFSVMQHYRNIKSPHGVVAGPHRGCALSQLQAELTNLGATIV